MSDKLSELHFDPASTSPRVDELIAGVMKRFPGVSASAQARYFEEVHQHLAPLARELEAENARLRADAASPAPVSTWPGYKRGFSDGQRAADRIHAQRAAPAADTKQLAEARKLIAHASEFAMMQLDDEWHERAAELLALPAPPVSASAPPMPAAAWVPKAAALPTVPGWYLVMLERDNDWELMSDTPIQVEFDAYKNMPQAFTMFYDNGTGEDITEAVTHWMPMPAAPGDVACTEGKK